MTLRFVPVHPNTLAFGTNVKRTAIGVRVRGGEYQGLLSYHKNEDGSFEFFADGETILLGGAGGSGITSEQAVDAVAAALAAGNHTNVTVVYDDNGNRINLAAAGGAGGGVTAEEVQDFMNTALVHAGHTNVTVTYDDANNRFLFVGAAAGGGGGGGENGVSFTANGLSQLLYLTANGSPLLPGKAISTSYTSNTAIQTDGTSAASAGWSTGELQAAVGGMTYYVDKIRFLAWYTITKTFISLVDIADGAAAQTVVAPDNAAYAKFTVKATNTGTAMFNPGSAANKINNVVLGNEAKLPALRAQLVAWVKAEAYQITSTITYNAGGKIDTTGTVNIEWPNGATGQIKIFYNADWTTQYYYLTYEGDGVRQYITQPAITYNGSQQPITVPRLTVSAG